MFLLHWQQRMMFRLVLCSWSLQILFEALCFSYLFKALCVSALNLALSCRENNYTFNHFLEQKWKIEHLSVPIIACQNINYPTTYNHENCCQDIFLKNGVCPGRHASMELQVNTGVNYKSSDPFSLTVSPVIQHAHKQHFHSTCPE